MVKHRKGRGLRVFLILIIVLLAGAAGVYLLLPGLSRPVDLGVKSTREAYERAMEKLGVMKDAAPVSGTAGDYAVSYGGPQQTETSLTSEELTSFFNENRPPYYAVKNVQVRINDDGTVEASGSLDTSYVFDSILDGQYSKDDARTALPMLGLIPDTVNVYFEMSGSVVDNRIVGLDIGDVSVMGIAIPDDLIDTNEAFIVETLNNYIARGTAKTGADYKLIDFSGGDLGFVGTLPSSIDRIAVQ